ncbi:hypothetical protein OsI_20034 [Oryza sativa Indica Group]|uniref:Uncharacterized protein n=2 Tax=Oryza TaxID=4527 RepID=A0A0E0HER0_ORYNI|nr:hypothetical protein OsI_20034 [Oryza sativa Indica Group]
MSRACEASSKPHDAARGGGRGLKAKEPISWAHSSASRPGPEVKRADSVGPTRQPLGPAPAPRHRVWGGIKEPPSQRRERLLPPKILILSIDQTAAQAQALTSLLLRGIPNRPAGSPASSA